MRLHGVFRPCSCRGCVMGANHCPPPCGYFDHGPSVTITTKKPSNQPTKSVATHRSADMCSLLMTVVSCVLCIVYRHATSRHVASRHTTSHHVTPHPITLRHITSLDAGTCNGDDDRVSKIINLPTHKARHASMKYNHTHTCYDR